MEQRVEHVPQRDYDEDRTRRGAERRRHAAVGSSI
jgi:hypothetical protein